MTAPASPPLTCRCRTFELGDAQARLYRNEPDGPWFLHTAVWCSDGPWNVAAAERAKGLERALEQLVEAVTEDQGEGNFAGLVRALKEAAAALASWRGSAGDETP